MLRFMRRYATGYLVKALFGIIIIVFIFWGVGSFSGGEKAVAQVGPHKISYTEYQEAYNRTLNFYRLLYKDKFDENMMRELKIKEKVMEEIVGKYLLLLKAEEMGIKVSDAEFNEHLASMNAFTSDGKFSQKLYLDALKRSGIDPKKFEESERANLIISKITSIMTDNGMFINEADLWASYVKEKGKVNLFYAKLDPSAYEDKVSVDEKELQSLYEKEKGVYKSENLYRLKYMLIDEKSPVKDDAAYMDLLKLKDIDLYGKKNGLEIVDTGSLKESELFKKFKNINIEGWIKGLKKGDISLPARDGLKSYIFNLIDMEEGKPFEKSVVIKELREKILFEKAKVFAKGKAEEAISKKALESKNETGFISRNVIDIPKIGPLPTENMGVLTLSKDHTVYEKPVEISGKYYVFHFKDEQLPEKDKWETDKKGYANYIMAKNKQEYFKSLMEELKKQKKVEVYKEDL